MRRDRFNYTNITCRTPCRTADEKSIGVRTRRKVAAVLRVDAAAIQDRERLAHDVRRDDLYLIVLAVGKVRIGWNATHTDGPDGFMGKYHTMQGGLSHKLEGSAGLPRKGRCGYASIILGLGIADADESQQAMPEGRLDLQGNGRNGFIEEGAPLAVIKLNLGGTAIHDHGGRGFAGPCAVILPMHVVRTDLHASTFEKACHVSDAGEWWDDGGLDCICLCDGRSFHGIRKRHSIHPELVHFPTGADDPWYFRGHQPNPLVWRVGGDPLC